MVHSAAERAGGAGLVLLSTLAVQGSAAISAGLFADLGPTAVAGLRQLLGALALLVLVRPGVRGRRASEWRSVGLLGAAMAAMNVAFYQAVALLPLGVAATLLYLGPFVLAVVHTPRGLQRALPCLALLGVVLVAGPSVALSPVGLLVGLLAATALAGYTVASAHLGRSKGLDSLVLATCCAAVLLSPFSLTAAPSVTTHQWGVLACAGALGVSVAFASDFTALRLAGTRVVSVLFALDPVVGALLGALVLSQSLSPAVVAGIVLIILTGATMSGLAHRGPD